MYAKTSASVAEAGKSPAFTRKRKALPPGGAAAGTSTRFRVGAARSGVAVESEAEARAARRRSLRQSAMVLFGCAAARRSAAAAAAKQWEDCSRSGDGDGGVPSAGAGGGEDGCGAGADLSGAASGSFVQAASSSRASALMSIHCIVNVCKWARLHATCGQSGCVTTRKPVLTDLPHT